ncbi:DUF317 domain-containing protein [Streptomyces sp. NPDC093510]|uniref:DUF317 domain-containing protein n=1 Tax=Streptomyces sp. NPDC093510 TaxID=3155199 RepID=UPI003424761B
MRTHSRGASSRPPTLDQWRRPAALQHTELDRERAWEGSTAVAHHESLPLRAIFDPDAEGREAKWTFAAYETPVSDRLWHGTATASAPTAILSTLLDARLSSHRERLGQRSLPHRSRDRHHRGDLSAHRREMEAHHRRALHHLGGPRPPGSLAYSSTPSPPRTTTVFFPPGPSGAAAPSISRPGHSS